MSKHLGNVLLSVFVILLDVFLMDSLLQHFLVFGVHWVFRKLSESLLFLIKFLHPLVILIPHIFSQSLHIPIHYKGSNFRLSFRNFRQPMWIILKFQINLFSRTHVLFHRFLPKLESLLFLILIKIFNHISDIQLWFWLLLDWLWRKCHEQ